MQFKDIEGQQVLINNLTEIIDSGRVSHAQMFLGTTASGSLALAIAYAQYLNCENRQHYAEGSALRADSCGECPNCRKYRQLMHSDLHFVFPSTTTPRVSQKPCSDLFQEEFRDFLNQKNQLGVEDEWYAHLGVEKKQGEIRELDANNIVKTLSLKSYEGGYKVTVIWLAERMNLVAANKLLKTLEEPTDNTVILMVVENKDRMLQTILSRVQQIVVPERNVGLDPAKRSAYAQMFVSWMRLLFKLNMQTLSDWVEKIAAIGREPQKCFLQYTQETLRACFLKTAAGFVIDDELQFGDEKFNAAFPAMVTPRNVEAMNQAVNDALYAIERNANPKLTFMQLSFTFSKLIKNR